MICLSESPAAYQGHLSTPPYPLYVPVPLLWQHRQLGKVYLAKPIASHRARDSGITHLAPVFRVSPDFSFPSPFRLDVHLAGVFADILRVTPFHRNPGVDCGGLQPVLGEIADCGKCLPPADYLIGIFLVGRFCKREGFALAPHGADNDRLTTG
jgi:hypothetical protein